MKPNVGNIERVIRISLGVILLAAGYSGVLPGWGSAVFYILGVVAIVTGAISFCPLWRVLGINTLKSGTTKKV
ncbi:MAG: YgaP family membrane protein [Nitrospiria bacterium]